MGFIMDDQRQKVGGAIICGTELCGCSAVDRLRGHGQDARSESRPPKGRPQILVNIYIYIYTYILLIYIYIYILIYVYEYIYTYI